MINGVPCGMGKILTFLGINFSVCFICKKENSSKNLFFKSMAEEAAKLHTKDRLELQSDILKLVINKVSAITKSSRN